MPTRKKPRPSPDGEKPAAPEASPIAIRCHYDRLEDPASLKFNPLNDNKHPDEQLRQIVAVFREVGIRHPVIVSRQTGYVVVGEGRARAVMTLIPGFRFPVVDQDFPGGEAEELAFLAADNQLPTLSTRDRDATAALIAKIKERNAAFNLAATGYAAAQIKKMLKTTASKPEKIQPSEFGVLVYADDEKAQKSIYERIQALGLRCKIVCS